MPADKNQTLEFYKSAKGDILGILREYKDRPDTPDISDASCKLLANLGAVFLTDLNRMANAAEGIERQLEVISKTAVAWYTGQG